MPPPSPYDWLIQLAFIVIFALIGFGIGRATSLPSPRPKRRIIELEMENAALRHELSQEKDREKKRRPEKKGGPA